MELSTSAPSLSPLQLHPSTGSLRGLKGVKRSHSFNSFNSIDYTDVEETGIKASTKKLRECVTDATSSKKSKNSKGISSIEHTAKSTSIMSSLCVTAENSSANTAAALTTLTSTSASTSVSTTGKSSSAQCNIRLEVNSVLCFICNKIDNYSRKVIQATVVEFFREDEIVTAKQALVQACTSRNQLVKQFLKRRIGENKTKANIEDIMNILYTLDENVALDCLPTYCVADISRLPVLCDEMSDISYIRMIVDDLKKDVNDLTAKLSVHTCSVAQKPVCTMAVQTDTPSSWLSATFGSVNAGVQTDATVQHLTTAATIRCDAATDNIAAAHVSSSPHASLGIITNDKDVGKPQTSTYVSSGYSLAVKASISNPPSSSSPTTHQFTSATISAADQELNHIASHHDDFITVTRQKKSQPKKVVIGGRRNTPFQGVEKKTVLCVNRLSPDTNSEAVSEFLEANEVRVFDCSVVKKRTEIDMDCLDSVQKAARFISMRICISLSDRGKVLSADLWPLGVTVRPWTFKARSTNIAH